MNKGFIALTSILIIGAMVLVISIGVALRSVDEAYMSLGEQEAGRAIALANLCAEQALMKLKNDSNYSGNESIIVEGESCDILAVDGTGNSNRTVRSKSTVSGFTKKVKVEVLQINPEMQINSWEEVSDFN